MAEVVLAGVSKTYPGPVVAVRQLDLVVADGELLVLVGPSGSGKSTTLRLIAGLEEPSAGEIRIAGRPVASVPPKDRQVAMVFQRPALFPHQTVYGNLAFGLRLGRLGCWPSMAGCLAGRSRQREAGPEAIDRRVRETASLLGIEALLERWPAELSGGEQQRVALGRALVREAEVVLFDEPLSNLDAPLRVALRRQLHELHERRRGTFLYVTHDQLEALALGQRVAVMDQGVLRQVGSASEVYDCPTDRFVAGFLGSPRMNFMEGELVLGEGRIEFRSGACRLALEGRLAAAGQKFRGRRAVLGVRPENVYVGGCGGGAFEASVSLVETLGDSSVVYVRPIGDPGWVPDEPWACKVQGRAGAAVGQRVRITVDVERAHLFDAQTGENVSRATI